MSFALRSETPPLALAPLDLPLHDEGLDADLPATPPPTLQAIGDERRHEAHEALSAGQRPAQWPPADARYAVDVTRTEAFTTVRVHINKEKLELFGYRPGTRQPFGSMAELTRWLGLQGKQLAFAMNAGMFEGDSRPTGLFKNADAAQTHELDQGGPQDGKNFYMRSSDGTHALHGVFAVVQGRAYVMPTARYAAFEQAVGRQAIELATQSGPMLVTFNHVNEEFSQGSPNRAIRNAVGVSGDGQEVLFVISNKPVTFYELATFMRDEKCPNALYLDGKVSSLYVDGKNAPSTHRLGPIVGVTKAGATK